MYTIGGLVQTVPVHATVMILSRPLLSATVTRTAGRGYSILPGFQACFLPRRSSPAGGDILAPFLAGLLPFAFFPSIFIGISLLIFSLILIFHRYFLNIVPFSLINAPAGQASAPAPSASSWRLRLLATGCPRDPQHGHGMPAWPFPSPFPL